MGFLSSPLLFWNCVIYYNMLVISVVTIRDVLIRSEGSGLGPISVFFC